MDGLGAGGMAGNPEPDTTYVRISDDGMQAFIYLTEDDGMQYDRNDLKDILRAYGVNTGFHESNLAAIVKKKIYRREVLAAVGEKPGTGRDGYYEYMVNTEDFARNPKIREDGSVDYTSMNVLQNVQEGDLLAVYYPADTGNPGSDVRGRILEPAGVKNLPVLKGRGISSGDADHKFYATTNGKVLFRNGVLEIRNVHEIAGDVDYLTGVIEFNGDVMIDGNVGSDVVIRASKSVIISGTVEAATIEAGEDVVLKCGINGNEKAAITCGGDLYADFIEQTTVDAKGNVRANTIINSNITSAQQIILTGRRGTLMGGICYATHGLEAACLGNEAEIKTVVQVGYKKELYNQRTHVTKQLSGMDEQLNDLEVDIKQAEKLMALSGESPLQGLKRRQLLEQKEELVRKRNDLQDELQELNELMDACRDSAVRVNGNVYRGCTIFINNGVLPVDKNTCYMNYVCRSGLIEGKVIANV